MDNKEDIVQFETPVLPSKGDKARGAASLGRHLRDEQNIDSTISGFIAEHELEHALADSKPGSYVSGYEVGFMVGSLARKAAYVPYGERSDQEMERILKAPRVLSSRDEEDIQKLNP